MDGGKRRVDAQGGQAKPEDFQWKDVPRGTELLLTIQSLGACCRFWGGLLSSKFLEFD